MKMNREKARTLAISNARIAHQTAKSSPSSFQYTFSRTETCQGLKSVPKPVTHEM